MGRKKSNKFLSVFGIFFKSLGIYFKYLDKTSKYLLFPVLGQILGVISVFVVTYYYNLNIDKILKIPFLQQNGQYSFFLLLIILTPFLALLLRSFYGYIVAFGALNPVFYTLYTRKNVKDIDFNSYEKVIENKLFQYVLLMLFVSILCIFPPMWVLLCLSFQVFALESDTNFLKAVSRSCKFVIDNMFYVILMLILVFVFTYWFLPSIFVWGLEKISVIDFLVTKTDTYLQFLPYDYFNDILSVAGAHIDSVTIAKVVVESTLMFIVIGFTLPFRCCCFTELYRIFDNEQIKEYSTESEEIIKRATSKKRKK